MYTNKEKKWFILYTTIIFIIIISCSLFTGCNKSSNDNKDFVTVYVNYGDNKWVKYDNVVEIDKPCKDTTRLYLSDGKMIYIIGGCIRWEKYR